MSKNQGVDQTISAKKVDESGRGKPAVDNKLAK